MMKEFSCLDENIRVEGIWRFDETHRFRRYPDSIIDQYPRLAGANKRCPGARLRFRTDSAKIRVAFTLSNQYVDRGMSFYQANAAYAYLGDYSSSRYAALVSDGRTYESDTISAEFANPGLNDVTVFFPRNPTVEDVRVFIEDGARLEPPTPHKVPLPFVFYGSSITEQGHTSGPLAYPSLLSRFFDADFYNFGASGNARGEPEIAEHLGGIPKSIFFYDYDHNAPSLDHLLATHEAFFKAFRKIDPHSPVIMTSRPANDTSAFAARAAVVRQTCENAVARGDRNVHFIDGRCLFGDADPQICTTDITHPNDLGHYRMAQTLAECIRQNHLL